MFDVAASVLAWAYADVLLRGGRPRRNGSRAPYAFTTTYAASDGYVYISPVSPHMWVALSEIVGHPEWGLEGAEYRNNGARVRDRDTLEPQIEEWTRERTRAEITSILAAAGVACGAVNDIEEAIRNPHIERRSMIEWVAAGGDSNDQIPVPGVEIKFRDDPPEREPAEVPEMGAHTDQILSELGYADERIVALRAAAVVA